MKPMDELTAKQEDYLLESARESKCECEGCKRMSGCLKELAELKGGQNDRENIISKTD